MQSFTFAEPFAATPLQRVEDDQPWHLDTKALEEWFTATEKVDLKKVSYLPPTIYDSYLARVPAFSVHQEWHVEDLERLVKKARGEGGVGRVYFESRDALSAHVNVLYQVSHAHYALAESEVLKHGWSRFPHDCCGPSAMNVWLSALAHGYTGAAYADSGEESDHAYVIVPFALAEGKGVIVVDPTSNQLWRKVRGPRNEVFVAFGDSWRYESPEWRKGGDVSPRDCMTLDDVRRLVDDEWYAGFERLSGQDLAVHKEPFASFNNRVGERSLSPPPTVL